MKNVCSYGNLTTNCPYTGPIPVVTRAQIPYCKTELSKAIALQAITFSSLVKGVTLGTSTLQNCIFPLLDQSNCTIALE